MSMAKEYGSVSVPADLWERTKRAYRDGKFEGLGYRSPSDVVSDAIRAKLVQVDA